MRRETQKKNEKPFHRSPSSSSSSSCVHPHKSLICIKLKENTLRSDGGGVGGITGWTGGRTRKERKAGMEEILCGTFLNNEASVVDGLGLEEQKTS